MSSPGLKSSKARLTLCDNVRLSESDGFINGRSLWQPSMYNWPFLTWFSLNQCSTSFWRNNADPGEVLCCWRGEKSERRREAKTRV
ncbi:hypothetical protein TNCT_221961 [Trichonephila clavata]|uniref:Uncharacterized protein n=1 Tax=Trichonephila clavata TaxID=2740835 RepID=A0A8X6FNI4_TRICU|nr:hypothetical protein TNCT_221961 [Trichonephila clavata]